MPWVVLFFSFVDVDDLFSFIVVVVAVVVVVVVAAAVVVFGVQLLFV